MIQDKNIIGYSTSAKSGNSFKAFSPATGLAIDPPFYIADASEIDEALTKAEEAFIQYRKIGKDKKADFLEKIAEEILEAGDELIARAVLETGLPEGRIIGERGRTVGQLRLFASTVREGSWVEASIDTAQPDREPLPKPDLRKMLMPLGPVVVFTASNFPLAFSTAGGDTASALAAGNPVIVKCHESHPGTNAIVASCIVSAARKTGMPDGVFSSLNGQGNALGQALVSDPRTQAVAFTGSYGGGKALYDLAAKRETPIPVFAEMGSINPVFLFPNHLKNNADSIAKNYAGSITLGSGQFCTNPGLILGIEGEDLNQFIQSLIREIENIAPQTMLNQGIYENYNKNLKAALAQQGVTLEIRKQDDTVHYGGQPTIASVTGDTFLKNKNLYHEVFGPYSLVVKCRNMHELIAISKSLKGQLTTTVMCDNTDISESIEALNSIEEIAGRILFNGVPTGVEVCHSMHHGGPFPATTDSRFTSVGTDAIKRFVRPLCWQNTPEVLLPYELKNHNPEGIWRKIDGNLTQSAIE